MWTAVNPSSRQSNTTVFDWRRRFGDHFDILVRHPIRWPHVEGLPPSRGEHLPPSAADDRLATVTGQWVIPLFDRVTQFGTWRSPMRNHAP